MSMRRVSGNIVVPSPAAILNFCIGFVPDVVRVRNLTSSKLAAIEWSRFMVESACAGGIKELSTHTSGGAADTTVTLTKLAFNAGIKPFYGGGMLQAADPNTLIFDPLPDKRGTSSYGIISKWTLDNAANRTGHFDVGVNTADVGVGSRLETGNPIAVDNKKAATILALSNQGAAANEVTLDYPLPTGPVLMLTGKSTMIGVNPAKVPWSTIVLPDGFTLALDADVNVATNNLYFEAEKLF